MRTYSDYIRQFFPGIKIQKLSINAGFSCPNRDGTIGTGGCLYCRNDSFTPSYCKNRDSVSTQIEKGKVFFSKKYPDMKYLAYFQSYTSTYAGDVEYLRNLYKEALKSKDILGLVISTRPDSLPDEVLNLLKEINSKEAPVFLEVGAETTNDETLKLINRNHTWADVEKSITKASHYGLHCGLHLIAGLPSENKQQILANVKKSCCLPIETLKIHHLQILKDTTLLKKWEKGEIEINPFNLEDYLNLCVEIIKLVPDNIIIERFVAQSPPDLVVAPKWNLKNYQFYDRLKKMVSNRE